MPNMCKLTQLIRWGIKADISTRWGLKIDTQRAKERESWRLVKCDTSWYSWGRKKIIWYSLTEGFFTFFSSPCSSKRLQHEKQKTNTTSTSSGMSEILPRAEKHDQISHLNGNFEILENVSFFCVCWVSAFCYGMVFGKSTDLMTQLSRSMKL